MEKSYSKFMLYVVLLIFVVSHGNNKQIGAEGRNVSKRCLGPEDCASWGPECHCNMGLHMCVCDVEQSVSPNVNFKGLEEGY
ncbi:unnamed protein product [Linum tenue]|uniref:Nodule Cysteine-Rich (NCR) secreted peptide n=1 Tax=Linum tenue TaxID=586396 RepID=A0AAV0IDW2_9ROSI|nr:unnamed protein product [Linum tenue]